MLIQNQIMQSIDSLEIRKKDKQTIIQENRDVKQSLTKEKNQQNYLFKNLIKNQKNYALRN